jgi:hypothetical protein
MPQISPSQYRALNIRDVDAFASVNADKIAALKSGAAQLVDRGADGVFYRAKTPRNVRYEEVTLPDGSKESRAFEADGPDYAEARIDARGVPNEKAWYAPFIKK